MDADTFTFAELEFVARDWPHWTDVRDLLSIGPAGEGVVAAGASSLIMRELARVVDGGVGVRADVRERIALLFRPSRVVSITRGDPSGLNVALALIPNSGERTCLVSLGGPGVYQVTPLLATEDAAAQLRDLILALSGGKNEVHLIEDVFKALAENIPAFNGLTLSKIGHQGVQILETGYQIPLLANERAAKAAGRING